MKGGWVPDPEDVAVAHSDVEALGPGMAGISQRHQLIGETACDVVIGQHYRNEKGVPATPHTIMIEGHWVEGRTVSRKSV